MKLIYLFNGRLPTEKAHGVQIARSCEAFAKQGLDVELVLPYRKNPVKESVPEYYGFEQPSNLFIKRVGGLDLQGSVIPGRLQFHIQNIVSVWRMLRTVWYDRDNPEAIFYARDWSTLWALAFFGFPFIAEIHDYRFARPRDFVRFALNRAAGVVVNSEGTKELVQKHYHIHDSGILVAPNGVDIEFFNVKETREEARAKLGLPGDKILVAYVGRAESAGVQKGLETYRAAVRSLDPGIASLIIGEDKRVPHKEIPLYLRAMDIVAIPLPADSMHSKTTSPIKLFEFLAAGKAIIASDIPSLRQYLDESNAVFFRAGDAGDLRDKIVALANDSARRAGLEAKARESAPQYSWDERARKIVAFINETPR